MKLSRPLPTLPPTLRSLLDLLSGSLIAQGLTSVAALLMVRTLGKGAYAPYAASLALATLAMMLFTLGLEAWLLQRGRYGPESLARDLGGSLLWRLGIGLPWLLLVPLVSHALRPSIYPLPLIGMLALAVWLERTLNLCLTALKARLRNRLTSRVLVLTGVATLGFTLLLAALTANADAFAATRAAIAAGGLLIALAAIGRGGIARPLPGQLRQIVNGTMPFWLSEALAIIYQRADITILALRVGEEAVALYAPAVAVASALYLMPNVAYAVVVPTLAALLERGAPRATIMHRVRLTLLMMVLLGVALAIGTAIIAKPLVQLLIGPEFAESGRLLQIVAAILFFKSLSFGAAAVLVAGDWQGRRTSVQAVTAAFSVGANWLLAPRVGVEGVTWLFVASECLLSVGYLGLLWQWTHRPAGSQL